jgi:branched-chain amino acid transport system permease protein
MVQQLTLNGIIAGSIYALIALSFTVIYRTVKFFHFAHGVVYTAGAYCAYALITFLGFHIIPAFVVSMVFTCLLGMAIDATTYLPLRKRKSPPLVLLIASFGIFIFVQNLIALIFGNQILTIRTGPIKEGYSILGAVITDNQIIILIVSIVLMFLLWFFIVKTKLGKAMRAVSDDSIAASVVGINPNRTILSAFAIGSALAGAAGILISLETNIEPTMGFSAILKGIIASIIGGIGSIPGAMLGGFFLGIVENLGIWHIPAGWKDSIAFLVLIVFLLFKPGGILNIKPERGEL